MAVSGIILAGGRSSRMGRDKTLLVYRNETLITRTVNEIARRGRRDHYRQQCGR
jgi:molybdopterin-guanine dinucleotide biosynthesis protein A